MNSRSEGVRHTLVRILRSGRVYTGVGVNALSSVCNFAVSLAIARATSIDEFGQFAIAFALYALATGLIRAGIAEPLLATEPRMTDLRHGAHRVALTSLLMALPMAIAGFLLQSPYLVVLAISLHGLCLFDYSKSMNLAVFERRIALWQEFAWLVVSALAAAFTLAGLLDTMWTFAVWCAAGASVGYISATVQKLRLSPIWGRSKVGTRVSAAFAFDFFVGSGSAQVGYNIVGALAGLQVVGSLRAAATLLGPVGIVVGSARTLAIPYLSRHHAVQKTSNSGVLAGTVVIACVAVPTLAFVSFLPDPIGELVLGSNWAYAAPVLPYLALEMLFTALTTMPFAGFRAMLAGRESLIIRGSLAVLRIGAVTFAAVVGGALAAAIAFAVVAAIGSAVWWAGYFWSRSRRRGLK